MPTTPILGLPYPVATEPANGPAAMQALATAMEGVLGSANIQTYTPTWTATGSVQPSGATVRAGWYSVDRGMCTLAVYLGFGASTVGGRGDLRISLPVNSRTDISQAIDCQTWLGAGQPTWYGEAMITTNVPGWLRPIFPAAADSLLAYWRSSDASGAVGTGIPAVAGQPSVRNGGNFYATGVYFTA